MSGKIKKNGSIRCHDKNLSDWQKEKWNWKYSGEANNRWVKDMISPPAEVIGKKLYINA